MKIIKIEHASTNRSFLVLTKPSFIEKLFGKKQTIQEYEYAGWDYIYPRVGVYFNTTTNKRLSAFSKIAQSIDNWRRRREYL